MDDVTISGPDNQGAMATIGGFMGGPIGAALGTVGSTLFGRRSARKERQNREAREDSAYQRAAADMEKAGLNRILALGSPQASSAQAQLPSGGDVGSSATAGQKASLETGRQKRMLELEAEVLNKTATKLEADAVAAGATSSSAYQAIEESKAREAKAKSDTEGQDLQNQLLKLDVDFYKEMGAGATSTNAFINLLNSAKGAAGALMRGRGK